MLVATYILEYTKDLRELHPITLLAKLHLDFRQSKEEGIEWNPTTEEEGQNILDN